MTNPINNYFLFFYPVTSNYTLEQLANVQDPQEWEHLAMVRYDAQELGTQEAMQTLSELYTVIKEKLYGVNQALDDIIGDLI